MTRIVVVGDALLDRDIEGDVERICPDAPVPVVDATDERARPGGAALAAALLADDVDEVVLVTALGRDEPGLLLRELLDAAGVGVIDLVLHGRSPEKVRVRAGGQTLLRLDRGTSIAPTGPFDAPARAALAGADAVLVADYGRGLAARSDARSALSGLGRTPRVWDPHPRGPDPVAGVHLATPNAAEAMARCSVSGTGLAAEAARAETVAAAWRARAVAITLGRRGAVLAGHGGAPLVVPAPEVVGGDACGAGDRFAGAAAAALAEGALVSEAVEAAVAAASAFVARGGACAFGAAARTARLDVRARSREDADAVVADVRARGGTVVATGGCFDLLHAGHVATLTAARRLGDCLVVLLNSDSSVRRLKGPDRPLQCEDDRRAVLAALDCVDAVDVFDDDTPVASLERLRPDVFVKGGDYTATELPEAAVLSSWGGQAVVVPYLAGRSSSRLIQEARHVPI
jgi:D-beta-D-heptose 7-phosphate kinase / D-beta-D-heptose 1-phosphate adenosyltransferase